VPCTAAVTACTVGQHHCATFAFEVYSAQIGSDSPTGASKQS